jgi:hypothetical protein
VHTAVVVCLDVDSAQVHILVANRWTALVDVKGAYGQALHRSRYVLEPMPPERACMQD